MKMIFIFIVCPEGHFLCGAFWEKSNLMVIEIVSEINLNRNKRQIEKSLIPTLTYSQRMRSTLVTMNRADYRATRSLKANAALLRGVYAVRHAAAPLRGGYWRSTYVGVSPINFVVGNSCTFSRFIASYDLF